MAPGWDPFTSNCEKNSSIHYFFFIPAFRLKLSLIPFFYTRENKVGTKPWNVADQNVWEDVGAITITAQLDKTIFQAVTASFIVSGSDHGLQPFQQTLKNQILISF